jgi:hypothetical protein
LLLRNVYISGYQLYANETAVNACLESAFRNTPSAGIKKNCYKNGNNNVFYNVESILSAEILEQFIFH